MLAGYTGLAFPPPVTPLANPSATPTTVCAETRCVKADKAWMRMDVYFMMGSWKGEAMKERGDVP